MSFQTITLTASKNLAIDTKFSEDRSLRVAIAANESFTLPQGTATAEELVASAEIDAHLQAGDLTISLSPGVYTSFIFGVQGAGATSVTLLPALEFDFRPTLATILITTGIAMENVRLATAASGGIDISSAVPDGVVARLMPIIVTFALPAGTPIVANRTVGTLEWDSIYLQGLRTSI